MEASVTRGGVVALSMSISEAVVLHSLIATSEFAEDLEVIDLPEPVDRKVMSDVQQALDPLIPALGTDGYGSKVKQAYEAIDPGPFDVGEG